MTSEKVGADVTDPLALTANGSSLLDCQGETPILDKLAKKRPAEDFEVEEAAVG